MPTTEKLAVLNRWTGEVQFTAEIECSPLASTRVKLGLAVRWARKNDADLRDAVLSDADLRDADLRGADLRGADLRSFKADYWMVLSQARAEVPGIVAALREGRINGSVYAGECACLVGTIANLRGVDVYASMERDSSRPAEQWFLMIREGDRPGDDTGGGFAAGKALEWAIEYCDLTGIDLPEQPEPVEAA